MEIRRLQKTDTESIEFIKKRLAEWWFETPEYIEQTYILPSFGGGFPYVFIAVAPSGQLMGKILLVKELEYLGIKDKIWILGLFVKEEFRDHGIARQLIKTAEDTTRELGWSELYLDTAQAVGYYQRLGGWTIIGKAMWKNIEEVTLMVKKL